MLWIFVRIASVRDSNNYPQQTFIGVNKGRKAFYHLSYWYMLGFLITANSF